MHGEALRNWGGGLFTFAPCILATNGTFTLDATGLSGYDGIRWVGHLRTGGDTVTVKGIDYIEFGDSRSPKHSDINIVLFDADFSFVGANGDPISAPTGIVFTNGVVLATVPTCPMRIANQTWIWPYSFEQPQQTTYPAERTGTYNLENHNYGVLYRYSLNADAIRVGAGCTLSCRPCVLGMKDDQIGFWDWRGNATGGFWERNVELAGGSLKLVANTSFKLSGAITGQGDIEFTGTSTTELNGAHAVTGTVYMSGMYLVFSGTGGKCPGSSESDVVFQNSSRGRISFQPTGYASSSTTAYVKSVTGLTTSNTLCVQANQTLTIGTVNGRLRIEGPTDSAVVVSNLAANAELMVSDGMAVTVLSPEAGATVSLADDNGTGTWRLEGPAAGPAAFSMACDKAGAALELGGSLMFDEIPSCVTSVTISAGADISGNFPEACRLRSLGGRVTPLPDWRRKVALWCDASAMRTLEDGTVTNTFVYANEISAWMSKQSGSADCIWKWLDCRPYRRVYAFGNKRYTATSSSYYSTSVFPFESTVGGLKCVSMGDGTAGGDGNNRTAGHMNIFNLETGATSATIPAAYAIMVFGSQNGCGSAVLGTQDGAFACSAKSIVRTAAAAKSVSIFTNAYETCVDGASVNPTEKKFNGEWQIISVDTDGKAIQGIGFSSKGTETQPDGRGYSSYADVLIFSEKPTESERVQVEEYLASKWGVEIAHTNAAPQRMVEMSGSGTLSLVSPLEVSGTFAGTLELNGYVLEIPAGASDFSGTTVTGGGVVRAHGAANLPSLGEGFTGRMEFVAGELSFTVTDGEPSVPNAILHPGTPLAFPAAVAVNLSFSARPAPGVRYPLICGDFDASATTFTLGTVSGAGTRAIKLGFDGETNTLYAEAVSSGLILMVR